MRNNKVGPCDLRLNIKNPKIKTVITKRVLPLDQNDDRARPNGSDNGDGSGSSGINLKFKSVVMNYFFARED